MAKKKPAAKNVAAPIKQVVGESPRSRYEDDESDVVESVDEPAYLPPRVNLDSMTKAEIAQVSMRHLGRRPDERATKDAQIAEVQRGLRGGLPGYVTR